MVGISIHHHLNIHSLADEFVDLNERTLQSSTFALDEMSRGSRQWATVSSLVLLSRLIFLCVYRIRFSHLLFYCALQQLNGDVVVSRNMATPK